MASPSEQFKEQKSFFHAASKVNTEITQNTYESPYKSAHTVKANDIWADTIQYCGTSTSADTWVVANPTIGKKYANTSLTEIAGSNGQAWYLNDGGVFIRDWISPVDVPHSTTNNPSYGFEVTLHRSDDSVVPPAVGVWFVDYYAGLVLFQNGYTPSDLGYGTPKITCYTYIGQKGAGGGGGESGSIIHTSVSLILDDTHSTILFDTEGLNFLQCQLPDASLHEGRIYRIKNNGDGYVSVNANFSQTIDNEYPIVSLYNIGEVIVLQSDGVGWFIVG